jgi:hypothetical protein
MIHDHDTTAETLAAAGPPGERHATIRFSHTTTRQIVVDAGEIRRIFGLGGVPAEQLIDRLVALLAARPSVLAADEVENGATWESDTGHVLVTVNGMPPGEAAEFVILAESETDAPNPGCVRCSAGHGQGPDVRPCACPNQCAFLGCGAMP